MTELQKAVGDLLMGYKLDEVERYVEMVKDDEELKSAPADVLKEVFHTMNEEVLFNAVKHYAIRYGARDTHRVIYIIENLSELDELQEDEYKSFIQFIYVLLKNLTTDQNNILNISYYHGIVDIFRMTSDISYDNKELYQWLANAIYNKKDFDKVEYFIKFNS